MRRYGSLLLVLCLATASLLAAAAFNSATVVSHAQYKIVNTNDALLALTSYTGTGATLDSIFRISGGEMYLDFGMGIDSSSNPVWKGLQPDSVYQWNGVFALRGRTADQCKYRIDLYDSYDVTTGAGVAYSGPAFITVSIEGGGIVFVNNNANTTSWKTDPIYFNKPVDVKIVVPHGTSLGTTNFVLVARAVKL